MELPKVTTQFEIIYRTRDDDSYFYSNTDYEWYIRSLETGDQVYSFFGSNQSDANGSYDSGVQSVSFEGYEVVTKDAKGKVEKHPLPVKMEIIENGEKVKLTFADGTTEERDRKAVFYTLKFGQPVQLPLVN